MTSVQMTVIRKGAVEEGRVRNGVNNRSKGEKGRIFKVRICLLLLSVSLSNGHGPAIQNSPVVA